MAVICVIKQYELAASVPSDDYLTLTLTLTLTLILPQNLTLTLSLTLILALTRWAEQKPLIELRAQIDPLLKAPGVVYHGMVSETELAQAYAQAGWYAYPSDKPETSGIALMKAQVRVRL